MFGVATDRTDVGVLGDKPRVRLALEHRRLGSQTRQHVVVVGLREEPRLGDRNVDTGVRSGHERHTKYVSDITVGLDIGTTSVKAIAVDGAGTVLARARVPHGVNTPEPGQFEHDADVAWRTNVIDALAQVATGLDVAAVNVSAMVPSLARSRCRRHRAWPRPALWRRARFDRPGNGRQVPGRRQWRTAGVFAMARGTHARRSRVLAGASRRQSRVVRQRRRSTRPLR